MTINMNTINITIEQIEGFLKGTEQLEITVGDSIEEKYQWMEDVLTKTRLGPTRLPNNPSSLPETPSLSVHTKTRVQ